jgi:hypothetical protein
MIATKRAGRRVAGRLFVLVNESYTCEGPATFADLK